MPIQFPISKTMKAALLIFACFFPFLVNRSLLGNEVLILENERLALTFSRDTGALAEVKNKLTGETYGLRGDVFILEAEEFVLDGKDAKLESLKQEKGAFKAVYGSSGRTIEVTYLLRPDAHFVEKHLVVTSGEAYRLKRIVISQPTFTAAQLAVVPYRYQKSVTYFGRTPKGGFFTGVELPFDASLLEGNRVTLAYLPNIKVKAQERLECEPAYLGVYHSTPQEVEQANFPRSAESEAMVAMTSAILGPPRHGLAPVACEWSEMQYTEYRSEAEVQRDIKGLGCLVECGIDWVEESHPWGGETKKVNALVGDQLYQPSALVTQFLEQARKLGLKTIIWPTMANTHPWNPEGRPFRPDKPEWLIQPGTGNCLGNEPFLQWLTGMHLDRVDSGYYKGWCIDADFTGGPGDIGTIKPVPCSSAVHDHINGDATYACERAHRRLAHAIRNRQPNFYIWLMRPPMDLGVWSTREADAVFTVHEYTRLIPLPGLNPDQRPLNVAYGDKIREWGRIRLHQHFFPHYIHQSQVFGYLPWDRKWTSEKLDYILLSALSVSPNLCFFLTTQMIPPADRAEIRKWLDWGRQNIKFLQVRKDLPTWPSAGKVDGSAHVVGDRGFICFFNPNKAPLKGEFVVSQEGLGLKATGGDFRITQQYPSVERNVPVRYGESVSWDVPGETAVLLEIHPVK